MFFIHFMLVQAVSQAVRCSKKSFLDSPWPSECEHKFLNASLTLIRFDSATGKDNIAFGEYTRIIASRVDKLSVPRAMLLDKKMGDVLACCQTRSQVL